MAAAARRRGRPDELARAALGLGAGLSGFEVRLFDHRQVELLREALDQLGDDDANLRAWVLARLSVAGSFLVAADVRVNRRQEAVDAARRAGDPRLLVYALSSYCDAVSGPGHTEQRLSLATEMVQLGRQTGDAERELLGRRFRLVARLEAGDISGVDAEIEAFERGAARLRWPLVEGLGVLARLLAEPGREFHVRDLVAERDRRATAVVAAGDTGEVLDARARREYKRRLAELDVELDEATSNADAPRAARAQIERDALVEQLTGAYGLGGQARRGNDPVERTRWAVTKQIHSAIQRIDRAPPTLGLHLTNSVKTGRYCSYAPEHPPGWDL